MYKLSCYENRSIGLENIYIFYTNGDEHNGSLEDRARQEYKAMKKKGFSVKMQEIDTMEQFLDAWSSMDNNGKPTTKVSLFFHSNPTALIMDDGGIVTPNNANANILPNISDLNKKDIYSIHLFAYNFLIYQNVQYVYGWDGSMRWNYVTGQPQLATDQQYFKSYFPDKDKKRSANGQIAYFRDNDGNITVKRVIDSYVYSKFDINGGRVVYEQSEPSL